jgi:histidinol-phosphate phosphatase family protein
MLREIEAAGGRIREVYYCPHRDEDNCDCRKPKTGMFERARAKHDVDLSGTYFIGDGLVDVKAGKALGMKTALVLSGKTNREAIDKWELKPDYVFNDLREAADWITRHR